jgi:hypothetical protein
MQRRNRTQYGKDPPSDNASRRRLKQFKDTGSVSAAVEIITPEMLKNTWKETEYRLDILRAMKCAHVEAV